MRNEVIKTIRLSGCSVGINDGSVEMGSGITMYLPSLMKIGSGIQKLLMGKTHTDIQTSR
jgi:hypothetical protein